MGHKMSGYDSISGTADCAECGQVRAYLETRGPGKKPRVRCAVGKNASRTGHGWNNDEAVGTHGLTRKEAKNFTSGMQCEICGVTDDTRRLVVDHCHKTGVVRGVLCWLHNWGMGMLGDDPQTLMAAVAYLQKDRS